MISLNAYIVERERLGYTSITFKILISLNNFIKYNFY